MKIIIHSFLWLCRESYLISWSIQNRNECRENCFAVAEYFQKYSTLETTFHERVLDSSVVTIVIL